MNYRVMESVKMSRMIVVLALFFSVPAMAEDEELPKVAVLDIEGTGEGITEILPILTEVLTSQVANIGKYEVVSGRDIEAMMGFEKQKDMVGCMDSACLAEIGGALGVDRLVSSNIGKVGATFVVNIKLINIREAKTEGRHYEMVKGEVDQVITTIQKAVNKLLGAGDEPAPVAAAPAAEAAPAEPASDAASAPVATKKVVVKGSIGFGTYTLYGIGGLASVGGVVLGLRAKEKANCANNPDGCAQAQVSIKQAENYAMGANVNFGVAALCLGIAVYNTIWPGDEIAETVAWNVQPLFGEQVGLALQGNF